MTRPTAVRDGRRPPRRATEREAAPDPARLAFQADVLAAVSEAVIGTDTELRVDYWGPGAERLYGWSEAEAIGRPVREVVASEMSPAERAAAFDEALQVGHWRGEVTHHRRDGTPIVVDSYVSRRTHANGDLAGMIGINRDVTERRRLQRATELQQARIEAVHDLQAAVLWSDGLEGFASAAAEIVGRVTGAGLVTLARYDASSSEYVGVADAGPRHLHSAGRRTRITREVEALHRAGQAFMVDDAEVVRADVPEVEEHWSNGWRSCASVPLLSEGQLVGRLAMAWPAMGVPSSLDPDMLSEIGIAVGVGVRQFDLRRQERAARAQFEATANRLELLHKISAGSLQATNAEELGREVLSVVRRATDSLRVALSVVEDDRSTARLVAVSGSPSSQKPGDRFELRADLMRALEASRIFEMPDLAAFAGSAEIFDTLLAEGIGSIVTIPLRVEGALVGLLAVAWAEVHHLDEPARHLLVEIADDVALALRQAMLRESNATLLAEVSRHAAALENRVAERTAELTEINAELDAFSYSVAHDLRAPLRAMRGFIGALLEDEGERLTDVGREYANRVMAAAGRMDTLIDDLLDLGRLARTTLQLAPVSLDDILAEAVDQLGSAIRETSASIESSPNLGTVKAHESTLVQVVANLLSNALKYVRPGVTPVIQVRVEQHDGRRRLWVADNGIGIEPEHFERIFRPFERLHGVDAYPGTGIGLAVVRRAMLRMGGTCGVEAELGSGSRFWIELPDAGP